MTELPDPPGRIDLRALGLDDAAQERIVGAVLAGLGGRPQRATAPSDDVLETLARFLPPRWTAAAAILVVVASAAFVALGRDPPPSLEETVAAWADRRHVPTNAELLSTFLGYTP